MPKRITKKYLVSPWTKTCYTKYIIIMYRIVSKWYRHLSRPPHSANEMQEVLWVIIYIRLLTIYIAVMTCPSLLLHPHSRVNDTSTDFGTVVQVLCETGYWFVDSATHIMDVVCQENSTWSATISPCYGTFHAMNLLHEIIEAKIFLVATSS